MVRGGRTLGGRDGEGGGHEGGEGEEGSGGEDSIQVGRVRFRTSMAQIRQSRPEQGLPSKWPGSGSATAPLHDLWAVEFI